MHTDFVYRGLKDHKVFKEIKDPRVKVFLDQR